MENDASFQLIYNNDGTYIQLTPAKENGLAIDFTELSDYLNLRHVDFEKASLYDTVLSLRETKIVKLDNIKRVSESECVKVSISADHMRAIGRFYPPTQGGSLMDRTQIINDCVKSGVKYGVVEENITMFLENRTYFTDIVLAKATPCIKGTDAVITYNFNIDLTKKPKMNEDGTVDFHTLDTISHVSRGDIIASLVPAVPGRPGITVCGGVIQPNKVIHKILRHGNKIHVSEDGFQMYSDVDGHATLVDEKVFVSDSFEIAADVDASTGDINFDGNVTVKGSVRTGYRIVANGDIIVDGVVEGAVLKAGGQIILKRGIQGMNKGELRANGNIVAKFIENATVDTAGYLTTEAILHSMVSAKGDIIVGGKKGFITGGEIRSGSLISVKTAGSTMGTNTLLEVGVDPTLIEEYHKIEKELPVIAQELERLNQNILLYLKKIKNGEKLSPDKLILVKTMNVEKEQRESKRAQLLERMNYLQEFMNNNASGAVKVSDTIYPGCKVVIAGIVYYVRKECVRCALIRDGADVVLTSYGYE
jgi:uncharacterized protein (DUF342 family)